MSVLDPVLHTPATTFKRCPFLFTVGASSASFPAQGCPDHAAVCAVASRYYREKSEIYPIAMHFAKHAAANALITGWKSVELAQAYIILSIYGVPARRWEEDRGWLYTGLAIRCVVPRPRDARGALLTNAAQNRHRSQLAPFSHHEADERDARTRGDEQGQGLDQLLQLGPFDCHTVRQAVDDQGRLVSSKRASGHSFH